MLWSPWSWGRKCPQSLQGSCAIALSQVWGYRLLVLLFGWGDRAVENACSCNTGLCCSSPENGAALQRWYNKSGCACWSVVTENH